MNPRLYIPNIDPAQTYQAAEARINSLSAGDSADIFPECCLQLLTHGQKTKRVIILFHGFTSCPNQFKPLGEKFHELGYNVFIPRIIYHGLTDTLTNQLARLRAVDLVKLVDESLNIAHGLGQEIYVMGLSMGGVMTTWAAQYRPDVDRAMIISPALGVTAVKRYLLPAIIFGALSQADELRWWNPALKEKVAGPRYCYPHFHTHALSQFLYLGLTLRTQARRRLPQARSIIVVTNANDLTVDNYVITKISQQWQRNGYNNLQTYEFPANLKLMHDLIDPLQPGATVGPVYPKLIELMTAPGQ